MHKILVTDNISPQGMELLEQAEDVSFDLLKGLSEDELAAVIAPYHGLIIRSSVKVTAKVLQQAKNLRVIGRAGVGVDNVDLKQASLSGVMVMNTPGANSMATAEHTMAMMLALARNIPQAYNAMLDGKWQRKQFTGVQLYKKTLGIVGLGRIGSRVALRGRAFGMHVIAYDPYISADIAHGLKVTLVTLDELFKRSDYITLHTALTPESKGLINAQSIALMKEGARLINCARGALIDEEALAQALRSGKLAGAALDVFAKEPLPADSPLRQLDNIIFTPHLAASTVEAQRDVGFQIVSQMLDGLRGGDIRNAVNMPLTDPKIFKKMRPYLALAEKVGSLQAQLADGPINRLEVELRGEPEEHVKLLGVALLKGALNPALGGSVNYVNAPHLARQRGIAISETAGFDTPDYPNLISCKVYWPGGSRCVSATIFHANEPRIVKIDNYRMDVKPEGRVLVIDSQDVPGVIGAMGNILGEGGVNIASMRLGRDKPGGQALSFIRIDNQAPAEVIDRLLAFDPIIRARQVIL